jgi:hypothetical protein
MEENKINEEVKEEQVVEEAKGKMKFIDKIKSKKTLIGVGLAIVAGVAIKAVLASRNGEDDGIIDAEYTECEDNESAIEFHEVDSVEEKSENE